MTDTVAPPYGSGDATAWAAYWMHIHADHPDIASDEGTMIGWFANAMQSAIDAFSNALPPEVARRFNPDEDFVVLPREGLYQFLGEMALPPWADADGSLIGQHVDCAPIAQRLDEWIRQHDLSDLYLRLLRGESPDPVDAGGDLP